MCVPNMDIESCKNRHIVPVLMGIQNLCFGQKYKKDHKSSANPFLFSILSGGKSEAYCIDLRVIYAQKYFFYEFIFLHNIWC